LKVALPARAKLNLDLAVLGRGDDGMHELRSRMQAIELHDLLEVEPAEQTSLSTTGFELSSAVGNTVLAAHAAVEESAGRRLPARFRLHKRVPPGSGLGGASSDAAATMRALVTMYDLDLDLQAVAPQVGADVKFFLGGGTALVEGTGERVTPLPPVSSWFAIAWPGVVLSTAAVYRAWDEVGGEGANELRRAAGRADRRVDDFAKLLGPDWRMTGSGSAFFCACTDLAGAQAAVAGLTCWTAVAGTIGRWA
jgi:4-diphosphocytidyl-2-C-methyl-D-erythritol kinase